MGATEEGTRLWHPFADMGAVRRKELVIERGEDVWVWDDAGKRYLDATASLWYCNVGHGRPEIAAAVAAQFKQLEAYSAFGDFVTPVAQQLAGTLADLAPMPARIFLTCGGGESIDTAAKIAQRYWSAQGQPDRTLLISRTGGYHGTNGYGTALAGIPANREGFGPQIETLQVPHDSLEAVAAEIEETGAERVAAVFVEPVIGAGGVYPPMPGYIEGLAEICKRSGVLFVADSVICGFGRLGSWFGVERFGVEPDMITFAKGVTSGYLPLGGVIASKKIHEAILTSPLERRFMHAATYSGHPVCCAVGVTNVGIIEQDELVERAAVKGKQLLEDFDELRNLPNVGDVRGLGMMVGVELVTDKSSKAPAIGLGPRVAREAMARGLLIRARPGSADPAIGDVLCFAPPLMTPDETLKKIPEIVRESLIAATA
jgi:putrescine aminotransferase